MALILCNQLSASVTVNFSEYCPLHVGDRWTLEDEFGRIYNHEVTGTEIINGELTYTYTNWEGNPEYANLAYDSSSLTIVGLNGIVLDPPRVYNGQDIENSSVHIIYEMERTVTTQAGVFQNVVKETFYALNDGVESLTRVQYFAKDVGLIKDEEWSEGQGALEYTAELVSYQIGEVRDWLFMWGINWDLACQDTVIALYLYDMNSGEFRIIKNDCNDLDSFGGLNLDGSKAVFAETMEGTDQGSIKVYDIASDRIITVSTFESVDGDFAAYYDTNDKILFLGGDGEIKRMDGDGQNVITLLKPEIPFRFQVFWLSPDRKTIAAVESYEGSGDYETNHYERLIVINLDNTNRQVLMESFLGEWNFLTWKSDSSGFFYYYHTFNGEPEPNHAAYPQYLVVDLSKNPIVQNNLSNSDLGSKEENLCFYTPSGYLLGVVTEELYDPQSGALIRTCLDGVTSIHSGIMGIDSSGEIYFADFNGGHFYQFDDMDCSGIINWELLYSFD